MTAPHDTPEAVEAMVKWLSDDDMHWPAAMLRRLHARAVEAEEGKEDVFKALRSANAALKKLEAIIATARADALREAAAECAEAARAEAQSFKEEVAAFGTDPNCYGAGFSAGLVQAATDCSAAILTLIPQEKPHAE